MVLEGCLPKRPLIIFSPVPTFIPVLGADFFIILLGKYLPFMTLAINLSMMKTKLRMDINILSRT